MRRKPTIRKPIIMRHVEPHRAHSISQRLDLTSKRRSRLPNIVNRGQPRHQSPRIHNATRKTVSDCSLNLIGKPPIPQQSRHGPAIGHMTPQRQPAAKLTIMLSPNSSNPRRQLVNNAKPQQVPLEHAGI
jgi:hypothetical protein